MECYKKNRTRVFKIYGIDPKDEKYNCHHIVTHEDLKLGLVSPDFDLNAKSNLYPFIIKNHNDLHKLIYQLEPRSPIKKTEIGIDNFQRVNLTPIVSFLFDPKIIKEINSPNVREKSTSLKFLVWKRQGVL